MFEQQLKIGDHIINSNGEVFVVTKINEKSYRCAPYGEYSSIYGINVPLDGRTICPVEEYFLCDNPLAALYEKAKQEIAACKKENEKLRKENEKTTILLRNIEWLTEFSLDEKFNEVGVEC